PFFHRLTQAGERPVRHRNLLYLGGYDLENASLQDHVRIGGAGFGKLLFRPFEIAQQIGLSAPEAETPSDELRPNTFQHPDIIIEVTPAIEQALQRNRS